MVLLPLPPFMVATVMMEPVTNLPPDWRSPIRQGLNLTGGKRLAYLASELTRAGFHHDRAFPSSQEPGKAQRERGLLARHGAGSGLAEHKMIVPRVQLQLAIVKLQHRRAMTNGDDRGLRQILR